MSSEEIDLIAELAVANGYELNENVLVIYSYDNVVKSRKMSFSDSLDKLRMKLSKDPKTKGIDLKISM